MKEISWGYYGQRDKSGQSKEFIIQDNLQSDEYTLHHEFHVGLFINPTRLESGTLVAWGIAECAAFLARWFV